MREALENFGCNDPFVGLAEGFEEEGMALGCVG